jgi:hypothetical protein
MLTSLEVYKGVLKVRVKDPRNVVVYDTTNKGFKNVNREVHLCI